jgi:hypothetical protein
MNGSGVTTASSVPDADWIVTCCPGSAASRWTYASAMVFPSAGETPALVTRPGSVPAA